MVQDSRVTKMLSRLGGVYRDPPRVNRDASSLLSSSMGQNLTPIVAAFVDDTGTSTTVIVLQGTIAIHYKGSTYQLLMDIYLIPSYPWRPPVCFVRLAPNMYLKENHKHVGRDGKVYLPYLNQWQQHSHNLIELTVAMSSVFSADPPVFSRAGNTTSTTTSATATTLASSRSDPPPFSQALNVSPPPSFSTSQSQPMNSWREQQQQLEQMMAQEAAAANAAAEVARQAEADERRKEQAAQFKLESLRNLVVQKVQSYCRQQEQRTMQYLQQDTEDEGKLRETVQIEKEIEGLKTQQERLKEQCSMVDTKTREIKDYLQAQSDAPQKQRSIDEVCQPSSKLHAQQIELAATNASISDCLYFLDRALFQHEISVHAHLKQVRSLAKQQFLVRAHLRKLETHESNRGS